MKSDREQIVFNELQLMKASYEFYETDDYTLVYDPRFPQNRIKNVFYPKKIAFFSDYTKKQLNQFKETSNKFCLLTSVRCLNEPTNDRPKESYWELTDSIKVNMVHGIKIIEYKEDDSLSQFATDVKEIFEIEEDIVQTFSTLLRRVREKVCGKFFRYDKDGKRIGVSSIFFCEHYNFVLNGGVDSTFRRKGVAQHIIGHLNKVSRRKLAFRTVNPIVESLADSKNLFSKVLETELQEI